MGEKKNKKLKKEEIKFNLIKYIDDNKHLIPDEIVGDVMRLRAQIEIKLK